MITRSKQKNAAASESSGGVFLCFVCKRPAAAAFSAVFARERFAH
jgi:hypothetical protein